MGVKAAEGARLGLDPAGRQPPSRTLRLVITVELEIGVRFAT